MPVRIFNNIPSLNAQRILGINNNRLAQSVERISSGIRINRGADDAAGLAISEALRSDIRALRHRGVIGQKLRRQRVEKRGQPRRGLGQDDGFPDVAGRRLGRAGGLCSVLKGSAPVNARAELPSPAMPRTTSRGLPRSLTNGLRWLAWLTFNAFALYLVVALYVQGQMAFALLGLVVYTRNRHA